MKIAIIENDASFIKKLKSSLEKEFKDIHITIINQEFKKVLERNYDFCFFDIVLNEEDGISLSKQYYQMYPNTLLVLMSSHDHLVYDTFDSSPIFFLRKNEYEKYFNKLIKKMNELIDHQKTIQVYLNKKEVTISLHSIVYIEVVKNTCYMHTRGEVYAKLISMNQLLRQINNSSFYRINYQQIINFVYVKRILPKTVELQDGLKMPISREKRQDILQQYHQYLRGAIC